MKLIKYLLVVMFTLGFTQLNAQLQLDVPYVPTPMDVVEAMLDIAKVGKNDVVYDLGCGDGRIVVTAAKKFGATGIGVDLNPERIEEANAYAKEKGIDHGKRQKEQPFIRLV